MKPQIVIMLAKLAIFTVLVPGTVVLWLPAALFPGVFRWVAVRLGGSGLGGTLLIALGAVGYFWCAWDFGVAGRGTPAPIDPPKLLVVRGPYRVVRNPMYISVLAVLLGESVLFRSWALVRYAAGIAVIFHLFVILYEEPVLEQKFGAAYRDYSQAVPRWFPRLR